MGKGRERNRRKVFKEITREWSKQGHHSRNMSVNEIKIAARSNTGGANLCMQLSCSRGERKINKYWMGPLLNWRFINFTSAVHLLFFTIFSAHLCARYYCIEIKKNFVGNKHKKKYRRSERQSLIYGFIFFRQFGNDLISLSWGGKNNIACFSSRFSS